MKTILASVFAIGLGLGATAALAQDAMAPAPDFVTIDADQSGEVSLEEAQVAWPELTAEAFQTADADGSGGLSDVEFSALAAAAMPAAQ